MSISNVSLMRNISLSQVIPVITLLVACSAFAVMPAQAFLSLTLYDLENGFFIPNDHKKYSVGENAGTKRNADGGIEIYVAGENPDGVPEENWLPINRKDENIGIVLRIYAPVLETAKTWTAPQADKLGD